jgi:predicted aldo/keto reductase-like oxidoreductase
MTKSLTYLASAAASSVGAEVRDAGMLMAAESLSSSKLIMRSLGRTGISVPIVSMGVLNAEAPGLIVRAWETGIRHFDTAPVYQEGRNEEMLGLAIRQLGVRDEVIIGTKAAIHGLSARTTGERPPAATKADTLRSFEASLKRLQVDHVAIFYLHEIHDSRAVDDLGVQEAMTQLKKEGRIRATAVSAHECQADVLNAVARSGFWDLALVAFNYTMGWNQALLDAMKLCASKGIGIIAMKTQVGGSERDGWWLERPPKLFRREVFGSERQRSVRHSAVLKWVLQQPYISTAIPGVTRFEHIDEDMQAATNLAFTDDERDFISNNAIRASLEFCQQCRDCVASCPYRIDIPTLMRVYMYAFQYPNRDHARFTLAQARAGAGLDVCKSCPTCSAICSHTVNIRRKIAALKSLEVA